MRYILIAFLAISLISCKTKSNPTENTVATVESLDSLVKLYPDSIPLLIEYSKLLMKDFHGDYSLPFAAKAFRLDTNNLEARYLYASSLINRVNRNVNDIEAAQQHLLYIVKNDPGNKSAYVDLANSYTALGDYENSFKFANEALKIDVKYKDAYVSKAMTYRQMGDFKKAKSSFETAVQQDPKFFMGYLQLGWLYTETEDFTNAKNYFITAKELDPTSTDAIYGVAYSYQQLKESELALAEYRHLIATDTTYYLSFFNQGYIKQYDQKQTDSAIYFFKKSIELQPEFVKGWHQLGMCYLQKGNKLPAYTAFKKALEYNPDFEPSQEAIMKCK